MDNINEVLELLKQYLTTQLQNDAPTVLSVIEKILPSVCTIVVALISSFMVIHANKKNFNREEISRLRDVLNNFYYPFLLLSKRNTEIYEVFSKKYLSQDKNFRTLIYLLDGQKFEGNDGVLLETIISNDKELNNLIIKNMNKIENKDLLNEFSNLSAHYTILELAYSKQLVGNADDFQKYVHPNDFADRIDNEVTKIQNRIARLEG